MANQVATPADFVGSIPEIYDAYLGPLLFDFAAKDLARRVGSFASGESRILEIACGTGILTEHIRQATEPSVSIYATDLNEAMLDYARSKLGAQENTWFETADAQSLPFDDGEFDVVICQFGIMFFPDKARAVSEFARVLKAGGMLAYNVWDSLDNNPIARIAHRTVQSFFSSDPPNFFEVPFGFSDIDANLALLRGAGFEIKHSEKVSESIEQGSATDVAKGFIEGNPGILQIRERATVEPQKIIESLAEAIEQAYGPPPINIPLQEIAFVALKR